MTSPLPDAIERRDNASFQAVLAALARPGSVQSLPEPGPLCVLLALVDNECRVFCDEPALSAPLRRTGAALVGEAQADHLLLRLDTEAALLRLAAVNRGSFLYPDQGATVIVPARIGEGAPLQLSGPGIAGRAGLRLGGVHPGLWEARRRICRYPEGIDMLFVDGPQIVGLPRSTAIEEG